MPRWLTTLLMIAVAALLTWAMFQSNADAPPIAEEGTAVTPPVTVDSAPAPEAAPADAEAPAPASLQPIAPIDGLQILAAADKQPEPTIGGTARDEDENPFQFEARFSPWGAAVRHIKLARYSAKIDEHDPLVLQELKTITEGGRKKGVYPFAVRSVSVNGQTLQLWNQLWTAGEVVSGDDGSRSVTFTITLTDAAGTPVLDVRRTWRVAPGRYDLRVTHTLANRSGRPLDVKLEQFGPIDLPADGGYLGDQRYVTSATLEPGQNANTPPRITTDGHRLPRANAIDAPVAQLYPALEHDPAHQLLWTAMDNRYFAVVTHGSINPDRPVVRPLGLDVAAVHRVVWGHRDAKAEFKTLGIVMEGATARIEPGAARTQALDIYAGPKDPAILKEKPEYVALRMGDLIVYNLGGFCSFCTFEFLGVGLLMFLDAVHGLVRDWGLAIILLVAVVRLLLHPLTKRAQVNMMKVSKQMQQLQPEMEKLKEKYADSKEKLNSEMMKLYKERGVNPAAMGLGCLPMVLQMPIWFALYAMLYFAIELRHEPAFYGVFQKISDGGWHFLADLAAEDRFISFGRDIDLWMFSIGSLNLLPILMGVVFYLQQKYTTAATPPANEQAAQQQKMMKWMTMLFPIFLYKAPSGLTLYILTSTTVGVLESRRVRNHLKELEDSGELFKKKPAKPGGLMDRLTKAVEAKQKQMVEKKGGSVGPTPAGPRHPNDSKKKRRGKGGNRF